EAPSGDLPSLKCLPSLLFSPFEYHVSKNHSLLSPIRAIRTQKSFNFFKKIASSRKRAIQAISRACFCVCAHVYVSARIFPCHRACLRICAHLFTSPRMFLCLRASSHFNAHVYVFARIFP